MSFRRLIALSLTVLMIFTILSPLSSYAQTDSELPIGTQTEVMPDQTLGTPEEPILTASEPPPAATTPEVVIPPDSTQEAPVREEPELETIPLTEEHPAATTTPEVVITPDSTQEAPSSEESAPALTSIPDPEPIRPMNLIMDPPPDIDGTLESPGSLTLDQSYQIASFNAATEKYFTFTVAEPGTYSLQIINQTGVTLAADFGTLIEGVFTELTTDQTWDTSHTYNFISEGAYCLKMANTNESGDQGSVSFMLSKSTFMNPLATENTLASPGELSLGTNYPIGFFPTGTSQYFTFTINAAGSYAATYAITGDTPVLTMELGTVSGETFTSLATDTSGTIEYNLTEAGTYYLKVTNSGTDGGITLLVKELIATTPTPITGT
ncbi:MAG: hypothetical protein WA125_11100, partial [Desulfosporosinus sp.]